MDIIKYLFYHDAKILNLDCCEIVLFSCLVLNALSADYCCLNFDILSFVLCICLAGSASWAPSFPLPPAMHTSNALLTNVPYTYHMMAHNYTISLYKHTNNHTFLLSNFSSGKYFWRLTREKHLVSLRPTQIHRFWRGLPANLDSVDAVYERPGDHGILFFKGKCLDLILY